MSYTITDDLLTELKNAARVKAGSADEEIRALAQAGVLDLEIAGVYAKDDELYKQAIKLYVKANYGYDDGEKFRTVYSALRDSMALCGDYTKDGDTA